MKDTRALEKQTANLDKPKTESTIFIFYVLFIGKTNIYFVFVQYTLFSASLFSLCSWFYSKRKPNISNCVYFICMINVGI